MTVRSTLIRRLKPEGSQRQRLALAAAVWTLTGGFLGTAGVVWLERSLSWTGLALAAIPALVLGWAKAHFILRRSADRILARLEEQGDGRCLWGFLPWYGYLGVASMIILGRFLRTGILPLEWVGPVYLAVGWGLFLGSRHFWKHLFDRAGE